MYRVVVVDDEPITRMDIAGMLMELGLQVVGEAGDGFDAVEVCRREKPDVVLLDVRMPVFDGFSAAETIREEDLAGCVILLTAYSDRESIERAKETGVMGYLVKPVEQRLLLPTIEVAVAQGARLRRSKEETARSRQELLDSRLIQRAQGVLAKQENISESAAYQLLRRLSMDKRVSIAALAQAILEQESSRNDINYVKQKLVKEKGITEDAAHKRIADKAKQMGCSKELAAKKLREELG